MKPRVKPRAAAPLSPMLDGRVLRVLAILLVVAQAPQVLRLPIWLSALGVGLVLARIALLQRGIPVPRSVWLLPVVIAGGAAIRWHYGYFFGREPGVALLFLMSGLKFMETRTERDGTLIICLAAFLAMTQFIYMQSLLSFIVLVGTVLVITFALHALSGTWKLVGSSGSRLESLRPLLRLTWTMLMQSLPLAVMLFLVFPRLTQPLWGMPTDGSAKTGLSDQMEPGAISELSLSDDIAFHAEFSDKLYVPPRSMRYWRGPVLSQFDGRVWRTAPRANIGEFPVLHGIPVEYVVTLEPHQQRWLFALDLPSSMPEDEAGLPLSNVVLTREKQLLSIPTVGSRMIYKQRSMVADRFVSNDDGDRPRLLRLPGNANPRTREFAREERERAGSDAAYIQAVLMRFNREDYGYTLSPPEVGANGIDDFLFVTRRGFCEHYAGAFTFLMRAAGIPARVVTGYLGGEINPASGVMIVRQSDAHAWVEVWIGDTWRRVDPTAAVAPERVERGLTAALPAGERGPLLSRAEWSWLREIDWRVDAVNHNWQKWVIGFNSERQKSLFSDLGFPSPAPWQIAAIIAAGVALWGFGFLAWTQWRQRAHPTDPLDRLWRRINRRLARAGLPRMAHEGPLAYARRLSERWPQHEQLWREMANGYAAARYGESDIAAGVRRLHHSFAAMRAANFGH